MALQIGYIRIILAKITISVVQRINVYKIQNFAFITRNDICYKVGRQQEVYKISKHYYYFQPCKCQKPGKPMTLHFDFWAFLTVLVQNY